MIEVEQILTKLLEQTPVIVVLGLGVWDLRKKINEKDKEFSSIRESTTKAIENLNKAHGVELKELYNDAHSRELKQLEALNSLTDIIEDINDNIK